MLPHAEHLSAELRQHCALRFWAPHHIPQNRPADETQFLLELITCRDAGRADLSLELIEIGDLYGWKSPWLDDNRARAEFDLGRPKQALRIWEQLARGDDPEAAAVAKDALRSIKSSCQLQQNLLLCCQAVGWRPRHIGALSQVVGIKLEQALGEIETCRLEGATNVSQQLINCCKDLKHESPWLDDNQARLLIIKDRNKAKKIWIRLEQNENVDVRIAAKIALKNLRDDASEATLLAAIEAATGHNELTSWREQLLRRRLETDGADSLSWRRESIRLGIEETKPWDLHTSQHQLFQQLIKEQLDQWNQQEQARA